MLFARNTSKIGVLTGSGPGNTDLTRPWWIAHLPGGLFMAALLAASVFGAAPALAGLGGSVVPSFPSSMNVGDIKTATITIKNSATNPNMGENVTVSGIYFTPSCTSSDGFSCLNPDPGVFQFATVIGRVGSSCANTVFTMGPPNPATGEFELIAPASAPVVLGPANGSGPLPKVCTISINFKVLRAPDDSTPDDAPLTTDSLARASLEGADSGYPGAASGGSTVVINVPGFAATPGDARVALTWPGVTTSSSYKLVYKTNDFPSSCNTGTVLMSGPGTNFLHSGLRNGDMYYYRMCPVDAQGIPSAGLTASAEPLAGNSPPVANAGANKSTQTLTPVSFSGSGSSDPGGSITSYVWSFGDGSTGSGVSTSHTYSAAGTYTVTLTVTDNGGASDSDTATVTVTNRPPIANAGPNQSTQVLTPVSFNGISSSDPDGNIVSYSWNFGDGTSGSGATVSHSYATSGTYTVTLTVTDNSGSTASDTMIVTVATVANKPPVANAGPNQSVQTLTSASFSGAASSDPDGSIVSYSWNFGDGTSGTGVNAMHPYATSGTYIVTLTVTDNSGGTASDTLTLSVLNRPPVAVAGASQSTQSLTTITLNGSGSSDPDGTISTYNWNFGDGSSAPGKIVTHAYSAAGTYTATLSVTDNNGASANSSLTVTVSNRPPVANAGPDKSGQRQTAVSFNGSGSSDPDGTITSYSWNFGDGTSGSGASTSHAYANTGTYVATLTVTDNSGATDSATATITITASGPVPGGYRWSTRLGSAGATIVSYSNALDASGNVLITGAFWGTVNLGGGNLVSAGGSDIFVAKYSSSGAHIWSKRLGGSSDDVAQSIAVDPSGDVIVTGSFKGTVNFGGSNLVAYYSGFGATTTDAFVVKLNSSGAHVWSRGFGNFGHDIAYGAATDSNGNVIVVGTFIGHVDVGGTMLVSSNDSADIFLAKYTPAGQLVWANRYGGPSTDNGNGVAVDSGGNIFLTGTFMGTADFGGGNMSSMGTSSDVVLAKYSPTGQHVWSKRFGDTGQDVGFSVATDPNGNVAVTGYFQGDVNFGGGVIQTHGSLDTFVAKYSATGTHLWSLGLGGTIADEGFDVAMDAGGNVVVVGTFQGTSDFGAGPMTSAGSWDIVVAKYSAASGATLWAKSFGSGGDDLGYSVAIDGAGNSTVTGYFQGSVNFGGGPVNAVGDPDVFILNLAP